MEEEMVPKKKEIIPEKEEKEIKNESEIKEQSNLSNEPLENNTKRKKSVGKIISRIIWILVFLFILFEAVIGILDMTKLNNGEEPIWYFSSKKEKDGKKEETIYHLGLYVIVKTKEGSQTRISLLPFFLK